MAVLEREPILEGDQAQLFRLGAATSDTAVPQELGSDDIARARPRDASCARDVLSAVRLLPDVRSQMA